MYAARRVAGEEAEWAWPAGWRSAAAAVSVPLRRTT